MFTNLNLKETKLIENDIFRLKFATRLTRRIAQSLSSKNRAMSTWSSATTRPARSATTKRPEKLKFLKLHQKRLKQMKVTKKATMKQLRVSKFLRQVIIF
jgi:hypothetical protein